MGYIGTPPPPRRDQVGGGRGEGGEAVDGGGDGLRRSSRVVTRTRRLGESQDFLDNLDVRDAAGPQVEVVDVERGDRERLAVVLHRQGGDVWAAGPVIQVVANADGGGAEQQQPQPQILQPGGEDNIVEEGDDQGGDRGEPGAEVILLAPFEFAVLPAENLGARIEDGDGWMMIDSLSAEACILCPFLTMEEVPFQHEAGWRKAWETVLQRWEDSISELEETRALKWLLFLPQALLRHSRRGGRKGRAAVAARFNSLAVNNWGRLVEVWKEDLRHDVDRAARRVERGHGAAVQGERDRQKLQREVLALINKGQVGRAASRITSFGVAPAGDPMVQQQLLAKYPARSRPLPVSVTLGQPVEHMRGLREALASLQRGISPGAGGCRAEYLSKLAEQLEAQDMARLEHLGMAYVGGKLPKWIYAVFQTCKAVALYKTEDLEAVRPLGLKHPLIKTFHKLVINQSRVELKDYLEPQQVALSPAGAANSV